MSRARKVLGDGFGAEGGKRGELDGAIRGEPPMGRYFGVAFPADGLRRGEDGSDRTPVPVTPGLLSKTVRYARELEELCLAWTDPVRFEGGGFSSNTAL
jgi:hypothetical protein